MPGRAFGGAACCSRRRRTPPARSDLELAKFEAFLKKENSQNVRVRSGLAPVPASASGRAREAPVSTCPHRRTPREHPPLPAAGDGARQAAAGLPHQAIQRGYLCTVQLRRGASNQPGARAAHGPAVPEGQQCCLLLRATHCQGKHHSSACAGNSGIVGWLRRR